MVVVLHTFFTKNMSPIRMKKRLSTLFIISFDSLAENSDRKASLASGLSRRLPFTASASSSRVVTSGLYLGIIVTSALLDPFLSTRAIGMLFVAVSSKAYPSELKMIQELSWGFRRGL
jgi:hypothetical protein